MFSYVSFLEDLRPLYLITRINDYLVVITELRLPQQGHNEAPQYFFASTSRIAIGVEEGNSFSHLPKCPQLVVVVSCLLKSEFQS